MALDFSTASGDLIRRFEGEVAFEDEDAADEVEAEEEEATDDEDDPMIGELELERGLNRFAWDLRHAGAQVF